MTTKTKEQWLGTFTKNDPNTLRLKAIALWGNHGGKIISAEAMEVIAYMIDIIGEGETDLLLDMGQFRTAFIKAIKGHEKVICNWCGFERDTINEMLKCEACGKNVCITCIETEDLDDGHSLCPKCNCDEYYGSD